ncbi:MAG: hypothetical protein GX444_06005 [Myxococcales bacterium]|nr:hypothetical protein [Myxococcales bacterium]
MIATTPMDRMPILICFNPLDWSKNMKPRILLFLSLLAALSLAMAFACQKSSSDDDDSADDDDDNDDSSPVCQPMCWQNSPEQATGSAEQVEEWKNQCEVADSGCDDTLCIATQLYFYNAPDNLKYAVQCESGIVDDIWDACIVHLPVSMYYWLGPSFGCLTEDNCSECGQSHLEVTGWRGSAQFSVCDDKPWDEGTIADVLAHEESETPCEEIADLRQCIRAFIPPYTHCVPMLNNDTYEFEGCSSADEPYNRLAGWRDLLDECREGLE